VEPYGRGDQAKGKTGNAGYQSAEEGGEEEYDELRHGNVLELRGNLAAQP
jgi:hypothetical protein